MNKVLKDPKVWTNAVLLATSILSALHVQVAVDNETVQTVTAIAGTFLNGLFHLQANTNGK